MLSASWIKRYHRWFITIFLLKIAIFTIPYFHFLFRSIIKSIIWQFRIVIDWVSIIVNPLFLICWRCLYSGKTARAPEGMLMSLKFKWRGLRWLGLIHLPSRHPLPPNDCSRGCLNRGTAGTGPSTPCPASLGRGSAGLGPLTLRPAKLAAAGARLAGVASFPAQ
jgi:hypothetical protein